MIFVKKSKSNNLNKSRVWEIDFIRGLVIIGMLIDHFIGNFWMLYPSMFNYSAGNSAWLYTMESFSYDYWMSPIRVGIRLFGLMILLVVCGISCYFSKKNFIRGFLVFVVGILISLFFYFYINLSNSAFQYILFGAITCIGVCILCYAFLKFIVVLIDYFCHKLVFIKSNKKENITQNEELKFDPHKKISYWKWIALGMFFILFFVNCYFMINDYLYSYSHYSLPFMGELWFIINGDYAKDVYSLTWDNWYLVVLGFNRYGSDWLGIFPYISYIFLGGFIGETLYQNKTSFIRFFYKNYKTDVNQQIKISNLNNSLSKYTSIISYPGKYSMWFYLFHQPVFILIIGIIILCCGVTLAL